MDSFLRFIRKSHSGRELWALTFTAAVAISLLFASHLSCAQNVTSIRIDASQPYFAPQPALYDEGSATSPSGSTIGINSRYLTRDGKPWLPVT